MELIDRYVAEVGRHLPEKMRPDVEKELRSTLEDALDDRAAKAGRSADEAMVVELLKEFGNPEKVAAGYQPPRYLIGPRFYPTFLLVVRIVLAVMGVLSVVQLGISVSQPGMTALQLLRTFGESLLNFFQFAIAFIGSMALAFGLTEYFNPGIKFDEGDEKWDPRKLPPLTPPSSKIKMGELIADIIFSAIAIVVFTAFYEGIGVYFFRGSETTVVPFLPEGFEKFVIWLVVFWALGIAKNMWLLALGRWTMPVRWFSIFLHAAGAVIAVMLLQGASFVPFGPETLEGLSRLNFDANAVEGLQTGVKLSVTITLVVILVASLVDLGKELYQVVIKREA